MQQNRTRVYLVRWGFDTCDGSEVDSVWSTEDLARARANEMKETLGYNGYTVVDDMVLDTEFPHVE